MTVAVNITTIAQDSDGVQTIFPYNFLIIENDHLDVFFDDDLVTTGFTVTGAGNPLGGECTFDVAPDTGVIRLTRDTPLNQLVDYVKFDPFPSETHERALDKLTLIIQELDSRTDTAGSAAVSAAEAAASASEAAASEAAAATSASEAATSASDAATSASDAATSASDAATSETNAATSASDASNSADAAAISEANAATSETNAANSADAAASSADDAASSADAAAASALLAASVAVSISIAVSDETTAIAALADITTFRVPFVLNLTDVRASLTTAQASGSVFTVDVKNGGVSIFSTLITIDNTEKTSFTAAVPSVISSPALAEDAEITVDVTQVGDGSATGLKIYLTGTPA